MENNDAEKDHWYNVMRTFLHYEDFVAMDLQRRQNHLNRLPQALADKLPDISYEKISALNNASKLNQRYFEEMVHFHATSAFHDNNGKPIIPVKAGSVIHGSQQHRNLAVLHSLFREWSKEGAAERAVPFNTIINELKALLPVTKENAYRQRVLVPGCGIGRLPVEIASQGYATEGNEFSAFMAIASNFVLNGIYEKDSFDICPWIETICNIVNVKDTFTSVSIPDMAAIDILEYFNPDSVPSAAPDASDNENGDNDSMNVDGSGAAQNGGGNGSGGGGGDRSTLFPRFSMSCGDFVEIYGNDPHSQNAWDCVVTCFFIDTAPVVLEYIDVINRILKPGGVWINLGPLLYHWVSDAENNNDERYKQSVELSYEELKHVIQGYGFRYVTERFQECTYTRNPNSMMHTVYNTVLFSVRKPVIFCEECTAPVVSAGLNGKTK